MLHFSSELLANIDAAAGTALTHVSLCAPQKQTSVTATSCSGSSSGSGMLVVGMGRLKSWLNHRSTGTSGYGRLPAQVVWA